VIAMDRLKHISDVIDVEKLTPGDYEKELARSVSDQTRLSVLASRLLLDTPPEERFDRITRLAAAALRAPVALISLVDDRRQFFKSAYGLPAPWSQCRETPLSHSFCKHVVATGESFVVDDATSSERVAGNPAISELGVRAYLGHPIRSPEGEVLGSLCVIDTQPRRWTDADRAVLADICGCLEDTIEAKYAENRWREVLDLIPQKVWSAKPDGEADFFNKRWHKFTGNNSSFGMGWLRSVHPDDVERTKAAWQAAVESGQQYELELRLLTAEGDYRWVLSRAYPLKNSANKIERWFGTSTDVNQLKMLQEERRVISQELRHRIKNVFAVGSSLISLSARGGSEEVRKFAAALRDRFSSLSRVYDYVGTDSSDRLISSRGAERVQAFMSRLVAPYVSNDGSQRIHVHGDDPVLSASASTPLALAIHELATNCVKYGALSNDTGSVDLAILNQSDLVRIVWTESGGPKIESPPQASGFGSSLIATMCNGQLKAELKHEWLPDGLQVTIDIPCSMFVAETMADA